MRISIVKKPKISFFSHPLPVLHGDTKLTVAGFPLMVNALPQNKNGFQHYELECFLASPCHPLKTLALKRALTSGPNGESFYFVTCVKCGTKVEWNSTRVVPGDLLMAFPDPVQFRTFGRRELPLDSSFSSRAREKLLPSIPYRWADLEQNGFFVKALTVLTGKTEWDVAIEAGKLTAEFREKLELFYSETSFQERTAHGVSYDEIISP